MTSQTAAIYAYLAHAAASHIKLATQSRGAAAATSRSSQP